MKLVTRSTATGYCAKVCRKHDRELRLGEVILRHPDTGDEFVNVIRAATEMHGEHCILCRYPSMGRRP